MAYLVALTFLLAPAYVIRFQFLGLPANFLLLWVILVWLVFLAWLLFTHRAGDFIQFSLILPKKLLILILLFSLAGVISLFVGGVTQEKLGQFLVWFIEPVGMFFVARYIWQNNPKSREIFFAALYIMAAASAAYAVLQFFTLIGLPQEWWGNSSEPKRALSFFNHPNSYALFITPVLAFLIPDIFYRVSNFKFAKDLWPIIAWLLGGFGLLLSLSRGGWLGLGAALGVFLVVSANRRYLKWALLAAAIAGLIIVVQPNFRYRLLLPFYGEKSSVARLSLWHTGWRMVQDAPILGKGLNGFSQNWFAYNQDSGLAHYNFPHNLFLNFWVETGFLGLISFLGLWLYGFWRGVKNRQNLYVFGLALFLVALMAHGQIDHPYFKNDLALVFWLIFSLGA